MRKVYRHLRKLGLQLRENTSKRRGTVKRRNESLNAHWSLSPQDTREKLEAWRKQRQQRATAQHDREYLSNHADKLSL
jgi:hypothetical protein